MKIIARLGLPALIGVAILVATGNALAVPDRTHDKPYLPIPKTSAVEWDKTLIAFEMRGKPWPKVLQWLAQQTELKLVTPDEPPEGNFTYITPTVDGVPKLHTLVEVFDMINEILQGATKHTLIRGDKTLTLISADRGIDGILSPRIRVKDLPGRGRTEIVVVDLKLAPDFAAQLKRLVGEFGQVTQLGDNRFRVRTSVHSLVLMSKIIHLEDVP